MFVDTNVLLYASFSEFPLAPTARRRMNALAHENASFWTSRQVLREFLAVSTRPGTLQDGPPIRDILAAARSWERQLRVAEDDAEVTAHLLSLLEDPGARGKQVHDANIAATMRRYAIPYLLTHNSADFARYSPWLAILPLEPAQTA
ncbi:MAG TPA: type II toxin-antitoxin system VapC family toxin [Bryobacteraceae bacterium]|nr:type II toxin-antitoxin system VapC family toxin [Bryobacteraceae bacterium]